MPESTASRLKRAVHRSPDSSRDGLLERLFTLWFRGFVYTQIWEDPRVDAQALQLDDESRILTISSGGCNVLNYLQHAPSRIVAVDLNEAHMALTRLKLTALRHLPDYETFFRFFGHADHVANVAAYDEHLRDALDEQTRAFWEERSWGRLGRRRIRVFESGLYDYGVLPRFQQFAGLVAQMTIGRRPEELLDATSMEEQQAFFDECVAPFFDNGFVRWLGAMPAAVYSLGIPPSQQRIMAEESGASAASGAAASGAAASGAAASGASGEAPSVVDLYRDRLKRLVCGFPLSDNYFAWQAFGRRYDTDRREALPPYLQEDLFGRIRYHADVVETQIASVDDALDAQPDDSLDSFVLLDAMDWMDASTIAALWRRIARVAQPGARIIFRTAGRTSVVEPALPPDLHARFTYLQDLSQTLHTQDRSAVYGGFHVYRFEG